MSTMQNGHVSRSTLKIAGTLALFGSFLGLLYVAADLFLLAFLAILLALGLRGLAGLAASRTPLSTAWSLSILSILILGSFLLIGFLAAPRLADQANQLTGQFPKLMEEAEEKFRSIPIGNNMLDRAKEAAPGLQNPGKLLSKATGVFSKTFGALANLVFLAAMTVFFVLEPDTYKKPFIRLFPRDRRKRMEEVLDQTGHSLRMWLMGRVLSMFIISVLTGLGLWWMGVPLALLLAVLAGFLNFIPNLGPIIALVPAVLLAIPMGLQTVLLVVGLYTGVQFLESYIFTPIIQKKAVDLAPALLLFSQVILGVTLGFLGLLLATPMMAAAIVLIRTLYMEDVLGDKPPPG